MKTALILEDVPEARAWLVGLVRTAFDGIAVEAVATRARGLAAIAAQSYDLVLIDLMLPDGSGLDVLRALRREGSAALCVVTTVMADDSYIVGALAAGADGYLLKDQADPMLILQLRQIRHGVPALSPSIARRIMEHFRQTGPIGQEGVSLTRREQEVLGLISRGLRNAEVAAELGLAETTVAGYIKSVYAKLGISSRAEAAWHANRLGLRP
jgi:DNA-binding NarL/FixJ family response regulator